MYSLGEVPLARNYPSLVHLLMARANQQPNQIAYTFLLDGEDRSISISYGELDRRARELGSLLQGLKLTGERAILMYPSGLEFIIAFLGCLYAGVIAVPAYPPRKNQSLERLQAIVSDCQAKEVLTTTAIKNSLETSIAHYPELVPFHWLATDNLPILFGSLPNFPEVGLDTLAFLQYTSGSTGSAKGVMVSHGNLLHNQEMLRQAWQNTERSVFVSWLPLFHDMGLIGAILQALYVGFPCVLLSPLDFLQKPARWLQAISHYGATISGSPNFAYDLCTYKVTPEQMDNLDLSLWQVAFNGAEPVQAETIKAFSKKFAPCGFREEAFYPCYGMAEATLFVSGGQKERLPILKTVDAEALADNEVILSTGGATKTLVGCGWAWNDQIVRIVDPDTFQVCPAGRVGEIWVSGASIAKGYWNHVEKTAETFHARTALTGEGPFLRTGDLGMIDEWGELFIMGRLKDTIVIRGRNHYPQDIEHTVERSHPALRAGGGAAFTLESDREEKLVIVQEVERTQIRKVDPDQVVANIREAIAARHGLQVHAIELIKPCSLPKTSSGKVQRARCRAKFIQGTLDRLFPASAFPIGDMENNRT
jgi:acyl-CoA synthetase (AMP-forming)/AMP-acid ligase II